MLVRKSESGWKPSWLWRDDRRRPDNRHQDDLGILEGLPMLLRIGSLIRVVWLAVSQPSATVAGPPAPEDIAVYRDTPYREGTSRQWKLDPAMKQHATSKPRHAI